MKKLMIAMGAAAIFTLGAQGEVIPLKGAMDFSKYTGVDAAHQLNVGADPEDNSGMVYWEGELGASKIAENDGNRYLDLDTTSPLLRKTTDQTSSVDPVQIPADDGKIIISSRVQFTAAVSEPTATDKDKILVWAKQTVEDDPATAEDESEVKLMVTAADLEGLPKQYEIANIEINDSDWYTLTIEATKTDGGYANAQFSVKVGEGEAAVTAATADGTKLFNSLLAYSHTAATTISAVGFMGTGSVDDIAFSSYEAEKPAELTVTISAVGSDELYLGDDEFTSGESTTVAIGETLKIYVVASENDTVTCNVTTAEIGSPDEDGYVCVTIDTTDLVVEEGKLDIVVTVEHGDPGPEPTDEPEIVTEDGQTVEQVIAAATSESGIPLKNCKSGDVTVDNDAHTVKVGSSNAVSIPAYYTATVAADFSKIELVLNEEALEEETEVSVAEAELGLTITESKEKLYYGLSSNGTVAGEYTPPTTLTKGTGEALTLKAEKKGKACFYRLYVTDIAPSTK